MADKEYIEREAAKNAIFDYICRHTMSKFPSKELIQASKMGAEGAFNEIDYVPAADVVSRSVFEQVKWERDMAMEQLKDHKIPFGCIALDVVEVVRCEKCKNYNTASCPSGLGWCEEMQYGTHDRGFCSYGERKE